MVPTSIALADIERTKQQLGVVPESVWVPLADQGRIEVRHKGEASLKLCA